MCISLLWAPIPLFLSCENAKRGMMYDGEVDTAGRPHGRGTLLESDGTVFRGRFDHGVRHGRGSLLTSDGAVVSGVWRADVLEGEARRDFSDGSGRWQECQYREGKALGIGRQYGPTGETLYKGPLHMVGQGGDSRSFASSQAAQSFSMSVYISATMSMLITSDPSKLIRSLTML